MRLSARQKQATQIEPHDEKVGQAVRKASKKVHSPKLHELRSQFSMWCYSVRIVISASLLLNIIFIEEENPDRAFFGEWDTHIVEDASDVAVEPVSR